MSNFFKGFDREAEKFMAANFDKEFKEYPFVMYDIGASGELYPLLDWKALPHQVALGFEPVPDEFDKLEVKYASDKNRTLYNLAIADKTGTIPFYVRDHVGSSSVYQSFDGMDAIEVRVSRIDDFILDNNVLPPDFIKVDTEGGELAALRSGIKALSRDVLCVVSEYSFWRLDENETKFSQLDDYLSQNGFILFDLTANKSNFSNIGGKKSKIRTGDALYFKDFKWLYEKELIGEPKEEVKAKLLKLVMLCYYYLYADYGIEVVLFGHKVGLLSDSEFSLLAGELSSISDLSHRIPMFPGRRALSMLLDFASYVMNINLKKTSPAVYGRLGNSPRAARRQPSPAEVSIYCPVFEKQNLTCKFKPDI